MRYKNKREKVGAREKAFIFLSLAAIVLLAVSIFSNRQAVVQIPELEKAGITDLSTTGFVAVEPQADVVGGRGVVSLTGGCHRVSATTDATQAESIKNGLESVSGPRPNTHEIMRDAFKSLGIEVVMVKITELKGENFFGKIILRQGNTLLSLDSRPSDGIALAVRTGSTIYFNETLLKERGEKIC